MSASFPSSKSNNFKSFFFSRSSVSQIDLAQADCPQDRQLEISSDLQPTQEKTQTVAKRALSPSRISSSCHSINRFSDYESKAKLKKTSEKEDVSLSRKPNDEQGALFKVKASVKRPTNNCLLRLSVNLVNTYKLINDKFYSEQITQKIALSNPRFDSSTLEGRVFKVSKGCVILGQRLGEGTYGFVHKGIYRPDGLTETVEVAFKVNKVVACSTQTMLYMKSIVNEADFYNSVKKIDSTGSVAIAELIDDGVVATNCHGIVQRLYNSNLYDSLKKTKYRGFSFILTASIAYQLFQSLSFLRHPSINKIHADLKPENLVLNDGKTHKIRIIDFGSACSPSINSSPGEYICSRFYRPPEIIFQLPFDHNFDTWSIGCLLFELHAGKPLFPANNQEELLSMIFEFLGSPSESFVKSIPNWQSFFTPRPDKPDCFILKSRFLSSRARSEETRVGFFERMLSTESAKAKSYPSYLEVFQTDETYHLFKDLIKSMIAWDSKDRLSPDKLEVHPFIAKINRLNSDEMAKKNAALSSDLRSKESQGNLKPALAL
jgi:serine/threonine protein kinase